MNILIIEDDYAIRVTLQELLQLNGHTVRAAADGIAGLQLAATRPDLILCDVGMPGLDGYQVLSAIQQDPAIRDIPFIFLTARADRVDQRRGMALGADDYITKPFTQREILDAINARIGRQRPLRERIEQLLGERHREISANWSHELLTPLNGVLGGLELLELESENVKPQELKELLGLIRSGAERQQRLSRKLIQYFELERLRERPAQIRNVLCAASDAIAVGARQAAAVAQRIADLRLQCESAEIALSAPLLTAAVAELVENAVRFSAPGQPVTLLGRRDGTVYRLEITDRGPGMTPEQRQNFGAFAQFDRTHREQQGLGLGLAIAHNTAALVGGSLELAASPSDVGLQVILTLPLASASAGERPPR
jgi:signal transduction histidine kinase